MKIYEIGQRTDLMHEAVSFFWKQWGTPANFDFYKDSILHSAHPEVDLPKFYVLIHNEQIIGSYALLRSDFISRQDVFPWLACLYVIPEERGKSLGQLLLDHGCLQAQQKGYKKIYLCTDLQGYYEKYGWSHFGEGYNSTGEKTNIYYKLLEGNSSK